MNRPIWKIALEIRKVAASQASAKINKGAREHLASMLDKEASDPDAPRNFLKTATQFRGLDARRLKLELEGALS